MHPWQVEHGGSTWHGAEAPRATRNGWAEHPTHTESRRSFIVRMSFQCNARPVRPSKNEGWKAALVSRTRSVARLTVSRSLCRLGRRILERPDPKARRCVDEKPEV